MEAEWPKGYKMGRRKLVTILDKMIVQDLAEDTAVGFDGDRGYYCQPKVYQDS